MYLAISKNIIIVILLLADPELNIFDEVGQSKIEIKELTSHRWKTFNRYTVEITTVFQLNEKMSICTCYTTWNSYDLFYQKQIIFH